MSAQYPKGSEWRKWDLQIHCPADVLQNQFEGKDPAEKWDKYLSAIGKTDLQVVGITNYFCINGYEDFLAYKERGRVPGIKLVLPNIEFRISQPNKEGELINLHVIFSDRIKPEKIKEFLARLPLLNTTSDGKQQFCSEEGLRTVGYDHALIEPNVLKELIEKNFEPLRDYLIFGVPRGYGSFRPDGDESRGITIAIEIDKIAHAFFGRKDDTPHFFDTQRYEDAVAKPVVATSDAHRLERIGVNFSWIKADPTFEGLKQIVFEPKERIKIQEEKPEEKKTYFFIDKARFIDNSTAPNFPSDFIELNQNITAIIGGRSTGKSLLMHYIAKTIDKEEVTERLRGSNKYNFDENPNFNFEVVWCDGKTMQLKNPDGKIMQEERRKILYIPPIDILFNLEHPEGPPVDVTEVDENNGDFTADLEDVEDEETAERDIQEEMRKRTFVVASRALQNDPLWVPVSDIFKKDFSEILEKVGITSLQDPRYKKYSARLQKVKTISDYPYVMQVLEKSMSYEEVTEIFVRVNSLGIKLRGSDLALAQITSRWKGFMGLIEDFAAEFKDDEDYIVETGLPVRMLVVFATHQSRFKTVGKISKEKLGESWKLATNGLRFAINFLRSNAGIDNLSYLSSPFLLIPIAVYAILHDEKLTPEEQQKLLRWFYLAHMRGHYSMGSSESILEADLSILFKNKNLDDLINQLHLHVKKFVVDIDDLVNRGIRSPFFSMLYFVLKHNGAKDWFSGLKLSERHTGRAHTIQYHHIFPKSLLRDPKFGYDKKEINEIANLAFIGGKTNRQILNKEPAVYLEKEIIAKKGEEALKLQLIPLDRKLWEIASFREFLGWRRKAIADLVNNFMKKLE